MADKYNLTEADIKVLKIFGETIKSIIRDFNQGSKVAQQMEANYAKVSSQLGIFTELLNKAGKAKIEEIKSIESISDEIEKYQKLLSSQSRQLAKYNEKFIDSKVDGATLDLEKVVNSKQFAEVIKKSLSNGIDATANYFESVLSSQGKKALNEIVKKTKKVSDTGDKDLKAIRDEVDAIRKSNGLITEEKKAQTNYTQTTLYGERELNKISKQKKKDAEETLKVEKQITEEIQRQTSTTTKRRGRPKKKVVTEVENTVQQAPTNTKNEIVPYKLGSLVPHPTMFKYPSTALVPTGIIGSRNSDKGDHLARMRSRIITDKLSMYYGGPSVVRAGASAPLLGLPQFSAEEQAKREARYIADNTPPVLGSVGPDEDEILRRQRRKDNYKSRAKSKGAYQVAHTGSAEAIMLGASSSAQGAGSPSSFEEQQQKEEDANNRRRFVTDLATAIIAAQKKNPIVDLLKWAVLIMGKHFPVLSAALITLAPLVGIFKGAKVLNAMRTALAGGKVTKNAPLAARLAGAFKGSNSLKALFGFGPNSWGSQLTKNVGAQFVNGFKNNGGIRGALSWGTKAIGVNMQSLPWVQKAGGFFGNVAKTTGRIFRHPQWMGALGGRALGKAALGAGKLALGASKFALRGLASPIMIGIDALCGFLATQGGKWWQRLAGMLLKIVTLGFMSDKKVRQIVGMEEKDAALQQQANNDEERRHQERIGWWDKFWAWLKNILPWGKKDGVKDNAPKDINKNLKKDTDKLNKANQDIDRKLGSTYKKGTREYNLRWGQLYDQYIRANTARHQIPSASETAKLETNARAWADKMMNEEAYKLKAQKTNNTGELNRINAVLDNKLPTNLATESKHGVNAVAMKNMGLRGSIWSENSIPYIAAANAGNLKALDNYVSGKGHSLIYTSAMGGHKVGSGHYKGNKIDFQTQGSVLTPAEYEQLFKLGYFGGNTGALGYEHKNSKGQTVGASPSEYKKLYEQGQVFMGGKSGNHYDFSIANGTQAYLAAQAEKKAAIEPTTDVQTKEKEQASSEIREGLAALVGAKDRSNKQERTRNIVLSSVDVTGSLGVWGITQLNNGVMRTGR